MLNNLFKKTKYVTMDSAEYNKNKKAQPSVPDGLYIKCKSCGHSIYKEDLVELKYTCDKCDYHMRIAPKARIKVVADEESFIEHFIGISTLNPLSYENYEETIVKQQKKSGASEAVTTGVCSIKGQKAAVAVMDPSFMMGSMGSVVGEKITLLIEHATKNNLPLIIFCASGGARMQEGIFSLMQMAKTSAALALHAKSGNLYISVLTDPTTGGVTASFAMLGDIIIAEPRALVGFAGPRVIEQTIRQKLPEGFQSSEFLLDHGFVDRIVSRENLKNELGLLLSLHQNPKREVI